MKEVIQPFERPTTPLQAVLIRLAGAFVLLYAVLLTLAPSVRLRTWQWDFNPWVWLSFAVWTAGSFFLLRQAQKLAPGADPFLLPLMMLLSGWGVMAISRLSPSLGLRQTLWLALGCVVFWVGLRQSNVLSFLRRYKYIWLTLGLLLTALTLLLGSNPGGNGPRLWLGFAGVYFQPSEPLKLLLVVYLAAYLADHLPVHLKLANLLAPTLILGGLALALLVVQRDLGAAVLLMLIYSITLYLASGRRRMLLLALAALLAAGFIGYNFSSVVHARVETWLNPWLDPNASSYQIVQSLIALASGGLVGRGPGLGSPGIIPLAVSDFIFPAMVEETGLLGGAGLLLAYVLLIYRGLRISLRAPILYHRYLAAGISAYFTCQVILIVGGNIRMLPLTGVTLPFLSYGGSSLLTSVIAVLMLFLISRQSEEPPAPLISAAPYNLFFAATCAAIALLGLGVAWYGIFRQDTLLARADNPRRGIDDRYVQRGALLDRQNRLINASEGEAGSFQRVYAYPPLILTAGYSDALFGQSGLEASQDEYLRGTQGNPAFSIWWNRLLYGLPPEGLDVRLSLDLSLQAIADQAMEGHQGGLVLLNASTGEVLAMASHPYFPADNLAEDWAGLLESPDAPLLNRATQGLYAPGPALAPIVLSETLSTGDLPDLPAQMEFTLNGDRYRCALPLDSSPTWNEALSSGCPGPLAVLGSRFLPVQVDNLFTRFNLRQAPGIALLTSEPVVPTVTQPNLAAIGDELLLSPLQMALVAGVISNQGVMATPRLEMAVDAPNAGWVVFPQQSGSTVISAATASQVNELLAQPGKLYWQVIAQAATNGEMITWAVAGTVADWDGAPLALALALEEDNAPLAQDIAEQILEAALNTR